MAKKEIEITSKLVWSKDPHLVTLGLEVEAEVETNLEVGAGNLTA